MCDPLRRRFSFCSFEIQMQMQMQMEWHTNYKVLISKVTQIQTMNTNQQHPPCIQQQQ